MNLRTIMKRVLVALSCLIVVMSHFAISTQPALAEFNRGVAERGRFNSSKVNLRKGLLGEKKGYIKQRELRNRSPFKRRVNVYDNLGRKKGYAIERTRSNGFDIYDKNNRKTGFYRKRR